MAKKNKWTHFWDMHSGGGGKEDWEQIFIEAPEEEAKVIFYNKFGHNPDRVTCTCCGNDYSISEAPTLEEVTKYHREDNLLSSRKNKSKLTIKQFEALEEVLIIRKKDIKPEWRDGEVPEQGFVWMG